jgi:hypothetical protein
MTAAFCSRNPPRSTVPAKLTICFGNTPFVPTTIGRTTVALVLYRPVLCQKSVLVLLEFCPLSTLSSRHTGNSINTAFTLRELQDQVGVVFHLFDSLQLRIPQESPFFSVAFKNELLRRRFRPVLFGFPLYSKLLHIRLRLSSCRLIIMPV